jgi:glycosyltransferase involved in cell wall biosynthesis
VRNAVPVARFITDSSVRNETRASLGIAHDVVVVITVAVFREAKRLERVVELARRAGPGVQFVIVGGGPLFDTITTGSADVPPTRLRFLGARTDVPRLLAAADVFLLTSDREGLPVALLEAMAAALPVVVPDVGGVAEVADDEVGTLVALGAVDVVGAFEMALRRLLVDEARRVLCGARGRARVRARFGIERMVADLHDVYRSIA